MISRNRDSHYLNRGAVKLIILLAVLILVGMLTAALFLLRESKPSSEFLAKRPSSEKMLFDFAGIFSHEDEYLETYLKTLRDIYRIEALIVTLPSIDRLQTIQDAAAHLMTDWKVGERLGNRGILLLFADVEKEVKIEVSYELEDVFTDLFTGYAEDLQLRPYFRKGDIGPGLTAVMEELERRAYIKKQNQYTPKLIADMDVQFASGGAGAVRKLEDYAEQEKRTTADVSHFVLEPGSSIYTDSALLSLGMKKDSRFPAGNNPKEAFEIMCAAFIENGDARDKEAIKKLEGKHYEVLENANRAVIFFGNKEGWDNVPYLFAKTPDGWKFDMVNQRKYVRYGMEPHWGVERGDHDYMDLLERCPYWMSMDIPWEEEDIYHVDQDSEIVEKILSLDGQYKKNSNDFAANLELARLGIMTARPHQSIFPFLDKAKALNPDSPLPYKYTGICYVSSNQYQKAISEIEELLKRDPQSLFGRKFLGYLFLQTGEFASAIEHLQEALRMAQSDCYATTTLARVYTHRFKARGSQDDRKAALELLNKSEQVCAQNHRRTAWLRTDLVNQGLLAKDKLPRSRVHFGASWYWYNYQGQGVLVYDVQAGAPAEQAGLQEGDFITSFEGNPINNHRQLLALLKQQEPGKRVRVDIIRGALNGPMTLGDVTVNPKTYGLAQPKKMTIYVTLGTRE